MEGIKISKAQQKRLIELEENVEIATKALDDYKLEIGIVCDHPADQVKNFATTGMTKCMKCDKVIG